MLDQCFRQANLKELSRDPVFFEDFSTKYEKTQSKSQAEQRKMKQRGQPKAAPSAKKGHERSMRVLSLCVSDSSSHLEQLRTEPYSVFIAQNARKERF